MGLVYAEIELINGADVVNAERIMIREEEIRRTCVTTAICSAFVLPGDSEPLLGAIPMEEMDVLVQAALLRS